jgi:hypothetical protein
LTVPQILNGDKKSEAQRRALKKLTGLKGVSVKRFQGFQGAPERSSKTGDGARKYEGKGTLFGS